MQKKKNLEKKTLYTTILPSPPALIAAQRLAHLNPHLFHHPLLYFFLQRIHFFI